MYDSLLKNENIYHFLSFQNKSNWKEIVMTLIEYAIEVLRRDFNIVSLSKKDLYRILSSTRKNKEDNLKTESNNNNPNNNSINQSNYRNLQYKPVNQTNILPNNINNLSTVKETTPIKEEKINSKDEEDNFKKADQIKKNINRKGFNCQLTLEEKKYIIRKSRDNTPSLNKYRSNSNNNNNSSTFDLDNRRRFYDVINPRERINSKIRKPRAESRIKFAVDKDKYIFNINKENEEEDYENEENDYENDYETSEKKRKNEKIESNTSKSNYVIIFDKKLRPKQVKEKKKIDKNQMKEENIKVKTDKYNSNKSNTNTNTYITKENNQNNHNQSHDNIKLNPVFITNTINNNDIIREVTENSSKINKESNKNNKFEYDYNDYNDYNQIQEKEEKEVNFNTSIYNNNDKNTSNPYQNSISNTDFHYNYTNNQYLPNEIYETIKSYQTFNTNKSNKKINTDTIHNIQSNVDRNINNNYNKYNNTNPNTNHNLILESTIKEGNNNSRNQQINNNSYRQEHKLIDNNKKLNESQCSLSSFTPSERTKEFYQKEFNRLKYNQTSQSKTNTLENMTSTEREKLKASCDFNNNDYNESSYNYNYDYRGDNIK